MCILICRFMRVHVHALFFFDSIFSSIICACSYVRAFPCIFLGAIAFFATLHVFAIASPPPSANSMHVLWFSEARPGIF